MKKRKYDYGELVQVLGVRIGMQLKRNGINDVEALKRHFIEYPYYENHNKYWYWRRIGPISYKEIETFIKKEELK